MGVGVLEATRKCLEARASSYSARTPNTKWRRIAHGDKYAMIGFDNTFNIMQQQRISYFLESFTWHFFRFRCIPLDFVRSGVMENGCCCMMFHQCNWLHIDCILLTARVLHTEFDAPFGRLWLGKLTPLANARLALLLKAPPKADSEALEGLGSESLSFWKWLIHQIPVVDRSNSKTLRLAFSEHESST